MFLVRKKKASTAHIWTGFDTVCRMYSTGGMSKKRYEVVAQSKLPVCTMCGNKSAVYPKGHEPKAQFSESDLRLLKSAEKEAMKPRWVKDRYAR